MFIFEDNKNLPISKLLSSGTPIYCEFVGNCGRIPGYLRKQDKNLVGIVFLDVNPRNDNTICLFMKLQRQLSAYKNMLLIPIVCAEEIAIRLFRETNGLNDVFDFSSILDTWTHPAFQDKTKSVEVAFKQILNEESHDYYCLKNRNIEKHSSSGAFFKSDCSYDCPALGDMPSCPFKSKHLSRKDKGIILWHNMPVRYRTESDFEFKNLNDLVASISLERRNFYSSLYVSLGYTIPYWVNNLNVYPYGLVQACAI